MTALTVDDLTRLTERDEWLGWGYLGTREMLLEGHDLADTVAAADQRVVDEANARGWTIDQLFTWANSKMGRWTADVLIGSDDLHANLDKLVRQP